MLIVYAEFNYIFVRGFFRNRHTASAPRLCESTRRRDAYRLHLRGSASSSRTSAFLLATDAAGIARQLVLLAVAAVLYAVVTDASCRSAQHRFEHVDL